MSEPRGRRRRRWILVLLGALASWIGSSLMGCMNPSLPFDQLVNLGRLPHDEALEAVQPGRLVVLQHGLARSHGTMAKLARSLRDHGYEVLNTSYPSYSCTVQEAAQRLSANLEKHPAVQAAEALGQPLKVAFVGHSMGGLVIRRYLARPEARRPWAVLFQGTPQRGAEIVAKRGGEWLFRLVFGTKSALQLHPESDLFGQLADPTGIEGTDVGVILGKTLRPEGRSRYVAGDDDGRVGVTEARLPGAQHLELLVEHSAMTSRDDVVEATLRFLRTGAF